MMGKEIERKYLVTDDSFKRLAFDHVFVKQGYLSRNPDATVRVRVRGEHGFITVKSRNDGAVRGEWEYEIPLTDANELMLLCPAPLVEKTRWFVDFEGRIWEVDEFSGSRRGLVMAEVELEDVSAPVDVPPFVGREVTGMTEYYNSNL